MRIWNQFNPSIAHVCTVHTCWRKQPWPRRISWALQQSPGLGKVFKWLETMTALPSSVPQCPQLIILPFPSSFSDRIKNQSFTPHHKHKPKLYLWLQAIILIANTFYSKTIPFDFSPRVSSLKLPTTVWHVFNTSHLTLLLGVCLGPGCKQWVALWSWVTQVQILTSPWTSCTTLLMSLSLSLSFPICKIRIITTLPSS